MKTASCLLLLCLLMNLCNAAVAEDVDLTGTWESRYQFGPVEELMIASIKHIGSSLLGSFTVTPSSGEGYSGVLFGTAEGENVRANYLCVRSRGAGDPQLVVIYIDSRIADRDTLRGSYYVQDSDMNSFSGSFEAKRR